jgi:Ser-tRNA(Ala) deacylase AlaX
MDNQQLVLNLSARYKLFRLKTASHLTHAILGMDNQQLELNFSARYKLFRLKTASHLTHAISVPIYLSY